MNTIPFRQIRSFLITALNLAISKSSDRLRRIFPVCQRSAKTYRWKDWKLECIHGSGVKTRTREWVERCSQVPSSETKWYNKTWQKTPNCLAKSSTTCASNETQITYWSIMDSKQKTVWRPKINKCCSSSRGVGLCKNKMDSSDLSQIPNQYLADPNIKLNRHRIALKH